MKVSDIFCCKVVSPQWFVDAINTAPYHYKLLLQKMTPEKKNILLNFVSNISKLGVMGFGNRIFDKHGNTMLFTLSEHWNKLDKNFNFQKCLNDYIVHELLYVQKNKQTILTRSGDKVDNDYLKLLSRSPINNGVVIYKFYNTQVQIFYFVCSNSKIRDLILNKLEIIEVFLNEINPVLKWVNQTEEMQQEVVRCLNKEQVNTVFSNLDQNTKNGSIVVKVKGNKVKLTYREIECLVYLQYGISYDSLSNIVGKSPFTIKDRINSLKFKLGVSAKKDLIYIARAELGHILNKFDVNKI